MNIDLSHRGFEALCHADVALAKQLETLCTIRNFQRDDSLVAQGQADNQNVYILLSGKAKVVIYSRGGHEFWLDDLNKGALFGEMAVLLGQPRTASVIALSSGRLAVMSGQCFEDLLASSPAFSRLVLDIQTSRVSLTSKRMFEGNALSVSGRVYAELMRVAQGNALDEERFVIDPAPSVSDFARRVNATRESVSRAISEYEKSGLIIRNQKRWIILAPSFS